MSTIGMNSTAWYTNNATVTPLSSSLPAVASPFKLTDNGETPPISGVDAAMARTHHIMSEGAKAGIPPSILEAAAKSGYAWETIHTNHQVAAMAVQHWVKAGHIQDLSQFPLAREMANTLAPEAAANQDVAMVAPGVYPWDH